MNKVYKWFEDNIYYSVKGGKASIYLENDDLFEFEEMLKELTINYSNLQSKIDKANMFIDKYLEIVDNPDINMQCVKVILKENK